MTAPIGIGEPAPWFHAAALDGNPNYALDLAAGRWVVVLLLGSAAHQAPREALQMLSRYRSLFDDEHACFFGVTLDRTDAREGRIAQDLPGIRWFLDYDQRVSRLYGAIRDETSQTLYAPCWLLLDPALRVRGRATLGGGATILAELQRLLGRPHPDELPAPILVVPDVLSRDTCRRLVSLYETNGGEDSGYMRDVDGVTTTVIDHHHKRRADHAIADEAMIAQLKRRLSMVLRPMMQRAFQFDATRIERWIVACYDAADGGHFRAHRDNTTAGTAHRRFACTINLNAEDHEGGELIFPEYGRRTYRATTGGAIVFSCSLLHEVRKVTRGRRYAFLPFLYDEEGARVRERNMASVSPELRGYSSGLSG